MYFDMEGFPFFDADGGLEYLFGVVTIDDGQQRFHAFRATDRATEKQAFEAFIDFAWERMRRWPDLHIYHYSHYEPSTLKRLMTVHATARRPTRRASPPGGVRRPLPGRAPLDADFAR